MNILFLSSWYPSKKSPNFGIFIKEHAHAIHNAGNDIVVVSLVILKDKHFFKYSKLDLRDEYGIRTIQIEINSSLKDFLYYLIFFQYFIVLRAVNALIRSGFKPDIIHSNVIFSAGIIGNWIAGRLHIPHVITEHWSRIENFMAKPILSIWARSAYLKAEMILPVSKFLKNKIVTTTPYLKDTHIQIIGNVVDSDTFNFRKKENNLNEIRFCAIATWTNKKNPDKLPELIIEALSKFQEKTDKKILLYMIGGGDKVPELKKLCIEKGLETYFTGYIIKTEIALYLQKADFLIHASTIETFGVVVAESLLCGTPVICSNVGALPELIDEKNGILCNNTLDEWLSGLSELTKTEYQLQFTSDHIKKMFSIQNIGYQYTDIYKQSILRNYNYK